MAGAFGFSNDRSFTYCEIMPAAGPASSPAGASKPCGKPCSSIVNTFSYSIKGAREPKGRVRAFGLMAVARSSGSTGIQPCPPLSGGRVFIVGRCAYIGLDIERLAALLFYVVLLAMVAL